MPDPITNMQHSNHAATARTLSYVQPAPQDVTLATQSLEATGTLPDLTSSGDSPAEQLPPEILLEIFSRLPFRDLKQANLVCKDWEIETRRRIKIVVKAKNSEKLRVELNLSRPGKELHIKFEEGFEFIPNSETIEPNMGVKSLTIQSSEESSNFSEARFVTLLQKFPKLEKLDLSDYRSLEFDLVDTWPILNDVKEFSFPCWSDITDEQLAVVLQKFPNLEKLDLSTCSLFTFDSVDMWPTLNSVKEVNLSGSSWLTDGKLAAMLQKFPNLEKLNLSDCGALKFDSVDMWPTFNKVKELDLSGNGKLTDEKLAVVLQKFPNLETLNLRGCDSLEFDSVDMWPTFNGLKELRLSNSKLTDKKLAAVLQKLPSLEKLGLSDCAALEFDAMDMWPTFNGVKELDLSININLTDEKVAAVLKKFPNLEKLDLSECYALKFDSVDLWPIFNKVKELNLSNNELTDEKLAAVLQKFPNLEKLNLYGCESLEFDSVDTWLTLNNLKELSLSAGGGLIDEKVAAVLRRFPNLEKFSLHGGGSIEFDSVDTWPTLNRVRKLNLSWSVKLTDKQLATMLQKFPNLEDLDLSGCRSIKFDSVDTWPTLENLERIRRMRGHHSLIARVITALEKKYPNLEILQEESVLLMEMDSDQEV